LDTDLTRLSQTFKYR